VTLSILVAWSRSARIGFTVDVCRALKARRAPSVG
jgi:hypothetical protein